MIEILGWLGMICFAFCGLPQLLHVIKTKSVKGLSFLFLMLWLLGEIFTLVYAVLKAPRMPLLANYLWNISIVVLLIYYYIKYRRSPDA